MRGNFPRKLSSFLEWIIRKEDNDRTGNWINLALILSFGIISIISSIFILYSVVFATGNTLVLMDFLSRIIFAGFFLGIGLGLLFFLRTRKRINEEDEFWETLKDAYVCLPKEEKFFSSETSQEKHLFGIGTEIEKKHI